MRANPFRGPLKGVGPEKQYFFGIDLAIWQQSKRVPFAPKKVGISETTLFIGSRIGFALIKIIKSKRHVHKNR
jgi:hypothetical protein